MVFLFNPKIRPPGLGTETVLGPASNTESSLPTSFSCKKREDEEMEIDAENKSDLEECKSIGSRHVSPFLRLARLEITLLAMRLC